MIDRKYIDEAAMFNNGNNKVGKMPVSEFEASVYKAKTPEKSLNTTDDKANQQLHFWSI